MRDARLYQILFLGLLLGFGAMFRDFSLRPEQAVLCFAAGLTAQAFFIWLYGLRGIGYLSALITCLSLTILLRADNLWVHPLAAAAAISSKFLVRFRGKHLFNPGCLGVMLGLLLLPGAWVSPGQWGQDLALACWFIALGGTVARKAHRDDVGWGFLLFYLGLLAARVAWLGQRWAVWRHQLESGSLLLFAFFMISDPKTMPDNPRGRLLHSALVAAAAYFWQFVLYRTNGLLWGLFFAAPLVPLWDALWPAPKFNWKEVDMHPTLKRSFALGAALAALALAGPGAARAFCGFYIGKADSKLFNQASKVAMVRDGDKTVLSLMNDYQGDLKEFALVVPVPQILEKGQIHIGDKAVFEHLDAYSAPRLVEYFDPDPCQPVMWEGMKARAMAAPAAGGMGAERSKALGVTVEAQYTVGEYDIVILSAKESNGLETWLLESGYKIPAGAHKALEPYIKQGLKFFVAKVNLAEQAKTGATYLRPLQFAFESPKFMLPIRLGMLNANGPQDLVVYLLTPNGRAESVNYRTVKLPSGMDVPEYVEGDFPGFYKALFDKQAKKEDMSAVFTEYAWNMNWCDPCAADPLSPAELKSLGVFWLDNRGGGFPPGPMPFMPRRPPIPFPTRGPVQVMLTRLHVRYTPETFPEDLVFQETKDQENYQARYVLRRPWKGTGDSCPAAETYLENLKTRREQEARNLAELTGWDLDAIRSKMEIGSKPKPWWQDLWK